MIEQEKLSSLNKKKNGLKKEVNRETLKLF
jgi:hypothetical protein